MALVERHLGETESRLSGVRVKHQLTEYYEISTRLIWQRQGIFLAATLLSALYFDAARALLCYAAVLVTELADLAIARQLRRWKGNSTRAAWCFLTKVMLNTGLSAGAICLFVVVMALQQTSGGHFTPLFFLFAAALFAAMNNHQLLPALILRLGIYGATFLLIAFLDIWRDMPSLYSQAWLQVFTVLFVMYFIIEISIVFLTMHRDRQRQLETLREEHLRALEAYKLKSEFVSTVSHELRTPLTSIKGSLDLITSGALGDLPETMEPIAAIATKNSARLADLINDILDIQKFESGEMTYHMRPLDVALLLREATEANQGYAETMGISLLCDLPDVPPARILGDEGRLMQVLGNIMSNALKFSDPGESVIVSYRTRGKQVWISVEDKGIGIPEGARDKVFDQFTQIDGSDQRRAGGTGLGMNISRQIIEQHGGVIEYDSTVGEGTTFYIKLDLSEPIADEAPAPDPAQPGTPRLAMG